MLWLCLHFPLLPLEVFDRAIPSGRPFAVTHEQGQRRFVALCNAAAQAAGLRPGMTLGAAYVLAQGLHIQARNQALELFALEQAALWAHQFTSLISLAPPQAILLEVGGSRRLFRGLTALLARLRHEAQALGYETQLAVAPTPEAASLLARSGREAVIEEIGGLAGQLADVPLAALNLPIPLSNELVDLGVHRLGDVFRLPRDGLVQRFGPMLVDLLDRALGRTPDPRPPYRLPPRYKGYLAFPIEIEDHGTLLLGAQRLLLELAGFLRARDAGIQRLEVELRHHRSPATRFTIGLVAPTRDPKHLLALLREHLQGYSLRAPAYGLQFTASELQPWMAQDGTLFLDEPASDDEARWIERLQARLGTSAVRGLHTVAEHRPERAWRSCNPGKTSSGVPAAGRPLWLLPDPIPLTGRNDPCFQGTLVVEQGAERIESGWWDSADIQRDYFLARHPDGPRYWVFRERRTGRWFLHGIFG